MALAVLACSDQGPETTVGDVSGTIRDSEGTHLAGLVIRASQVGAADRQAVSAADGTFELHIMRAGPWQLTYDGSNDYEDHSLPVTVQAGSTVNVAMVIARRIRVFGSVVGSVRSAMGGVSGVTVHLTHMESNTQQTGTTRADGSFTIEGVPVGTVRLSVDPTLEAFAPPVVVSVQEAPVGAAVITLLPRSALRPLAYVRCLRWEGDYEYCAHGQLSVSNSDGTGGRVVLEGEASRPSWSPDGQELVFVYQGRLHLINVSGSGLVQLSPFTGMSTPVWSPDGDRILFAGSQAFSPLYFGNLPGFGITAVPNTEGATEPALSPDGGRIAFAVGGVLKVVNTDGSGLITLISSEAAHPTWSPDGQRIVFSRGGNIGIIGANGGTPVSLGPGYCPEWSPDGSLIAVLGSAEPLYLDDVVVASLHMEDAIWCTHAWSPVAALLP